VRTATQDRQYIDFGPRTGNADALGQVVFRVVEEVTPATDQIATVQPAGQTTASQTGQTADQTAAGQTAADQTAAGQTATGQTAAGQTATGQTATGQTATGQTATGQTATGQTAAVQTATDQTAEDQTATGQTATGQTAATDAALDVVRVAIANGPAERFETIEKGRAPFKQVERADADLIWDVGDSKALSYGDLIMEKVDGSVLNSVIDRTWAVREIKKLAQTRILDVRFGDGQIYIAGDQPTLVAAGIRSSYLTVVNVAADGTLQLLFPVRASQDPHMTTDEWTYSPKVTSPFGTDYTVVIATSIKPDKLLNWLKAHDTQQSAFEFPGVLAEQIRADGTTRIGTTGLFTAASRSN
jgi:hypothetical protein